jgi:hypothetical protein
MTATRWVGLSNKAALKPAKPLPTIRTSNTSGLVLWGEFLEFMAFYDGV